MKEIDICDYVRGENDLLVDVRDKTLYGHGTLTGAINIPMDNIKELYSLPKDKNIYVFCQVGDYSAEVVELLSDEGYNACNLAGGYRKYLRYILSQQPLQ